MIKLPEHTGWLAFQDGLRRALAGMQERHDLIPNDIDGLLQHLQGMFQDGATRCGLPYPEITIANGEKLP